LEKNVYLGNTDIKSFVTWMSANLDNKTFKHYYFNRKSKERWDCESLYDAFTNYHWRHSAIPRLKTPDGVTFASNNLALDALGKDLRKSLFPLHDDAVACRAAVDVMEWGGVRFGNVRWLNAQTKGLAQLLEDTRKGLNAGDDQNSALTAGNLRFNAGMTKVYSLICDDFVIYDSRVAAALGWAVVKFCQDKEMLTVPEALRFPWAYAKEGAKHADPKRRDPSEGDFHFPGLQSGHLHAKWNLRASWLLKAILGQAKCSKFNRNPGEPLRKLEAALFMIGYDLPKVHKSTITDFSPISAATDHPSAGPVSSDEWNDCQTLAQGNLFRYRITADAIEVKNGVKISDVEVNATLTSLYKCFFTNPFPLANSATKVRNKSAKNGFGSAYYDATERNPPDTSKLAAVLEEVGAIIPFEAHLQRGMHWILNVDLLGLKAPDASVNIRPALNNLLAIEEET